MQNLPTNTTQPAYPCRVYCTVSGRGCAQVHMYRTSPMTFQNPPPSPILPPWHCPAATPACSLTVPATGPAVPAASPPFLCAPNLAATEALPPHCYWVPHAPPATAGPAPVRPAVQLLPGRPSTAAANTPGYVARSPFMAAAAYASGAHQHFDPSPGPRQGPGAPLQGVLRHTGSSVSSQSRKGRRGGARYGVPDAFGRRTGGDSWLQYCSR